MDAPATAIVADILSDRNARATTFGLDSVLATHGWSAVKTGTSKDLRDNWCVGFTDRYTVGVWVGNSSGAAMWDVSGTTGAAPVWAAVVGYLQKRDGAAGEPPGDGTPGVVRRAIRFDGDLEAPREELFLAGTGRRPYCAWRNDEPNCASHWHVDGHRPAGRRNDRRNRSRHPAVETAVDIREVRSRRRAFAVETRRSRPRIGAGQFEWSVWPGEHRLELVDNSNKVIDRVVVRVRGAEARSRKHAI